MNTARDRKVVLGRNTDEIRIRALLSPMVSCARKERWIWASNIFEMVVGCIGNGRVRVLRPSPMIGESDDMHDTSCLRLNQELRPVLFSVAPLTPMEIGDEIISGFEARRIIGLEVRRTAGISIVYYMHEPICIIVPAFDYSMVSSGSIVTSEGTEMQTISEIYYLPMLYLLMERGIDYPWIFDYEKELISRLEEPAAERTGGGMDESSQIESKGWRDERRGHPQGHQHQYNQDDSEKVVKLLSSTLGNQLYLTGLSAAAICLGERINLPIEIAVSEFGELHSLGEKEHWEERMFQIAHPCGMRYINTFQLISQGRLQVIAYDTLRFEVSTIHSIPGEKKVGELSLSITSPFINLFHMCISEWLLARRGIERYKYIRRRMCEYREKILIDPSMKTTCVGLVGVSRDWIGSLYASRPLSGSTAPRAELGK